MTNKKTQSRVSTQQVLNRNSYYKTISGKAPVDWHRRWMSWMGVILGMIVGLGVGTISWIVIAVSTPDTSDTSGQSTTLLIAIFISLAATGYITWAFSKNSKLVVRVCISLAVIYLAVWLYLVLHPDFAIGSLTI